MDNPQMHAMPDRFFLSKGARGGDQSEEHFRITIKIPQSAIAQVIGPIGQTIRIIQDVASD